MNILNLNLKDEIKRQIKELNTSLEVHKQCISNLYILAKLDILKIENINDEISTLEGILDDLNELQERIIRRNTEKR